MPDWYQMPALILTALLLPAFGHLYFRTRDTRNLLWFLAFCVVLIRMFLLYPASAWEMWDPSRPWTAAAGQACAMLASGLFLASLSPLSFRIGKVRILYVIPFITPLLVYAVLSYGVYHQVAPHGPMYWTFPGLALIAIAVGLRWGAAQGTLPPMVGVGACTLFGTCAMWLYFWTGLFWPLVLAESGNHIMTALLVISVFRKVSPGVVISVLGFVIWACPILLIIPAFHGDILGVLTMRLIVMAKVAAALGLVFLALETELAVNRAAGERERRARREIEAYGALQLSRRRVEDFDRQGDQICEAVAVNSRFSQVALLLLHPAGMYRVAGSAGMDGATTRALDSLAVRIPVAEFLSFSTAVTNGLTVQLDLAPWLQPGDDLERLCFTSALATPMQGRAAVEGALLLSGLRKPEELLRPDDLVPIEILAARLQSVRSQTRMLEKLIDSERFAGLGQLAGNVTQQLNNPLTVILGYASLLEDSPRLEAPEHKGVEAILGAARSMRLTLESLHRVARAPSGQLAAVSVTEMLADMERLHRTEFLQRSIKFRLNVPSDLPQVRGHAQQLRQAVLHCLQFAMESVDLVEMESDRMVRLEAKAEGDQVQITIAHSGPGFEHPDRAFDPFVPPQSGGGEAAGLGLSLCATILRDNRGNAVAMNLEPRGAAIVLELQAA
ncbi:MAG TPA: histidine kinase dimerization/phospho-acceptor domain-containing protein [Terracidiphilus sp.]|jgi:signal transduction histidine kinase